MGADADHTAARIAVGKRGTVPRRMKSMTTGAARITATRASRPATAVWTSDGRSRRARLRMTRRILQRRRGGYCFQQNGLFLAVLTELGFAVRPNLARVHRNRPVPGGRTGFIEGHCDGESMEPGRVEQ